VGLSACQTGQVLPTSRGEASGSGIMKAAGQTGVAATGDGSSHQTRETPAQPGAESPVPAAGQTAASGLASSAPAILTPSSADPASLAAGPATGSAAPGGASNPAPTAGKSGGVATPVVPDENPSEEAGRAETHQAGTGSESEGLAPEVDATPAQPASPAGFDQTPTLPGSLEPPPATAVTAEGQAMAKEVPGGVRGAARRVLKPQPSTPEPDPEPATGSELSRLAPASGSGHDVTRLAPAMSSQDPDSASHHGTGQESAQRGEPAGALRATAPVAPADHEPATPINAPEGVAVREGAATRSALSPTGLQLVVSATRMSATSGGMQVRLTLHPESLGEVMVQVRWERGILTARLDAATPEARAALEGGLGSLRTALAEQGVAVERLQVGLQLGPDAQAQQHAPGEREADSPRPRQEEMIPSTVAPRPASEATSRLDVRV